MQKVEAGVGIGPFLARFLIKNAIFYGLHKLTRSLLTHCTVTAPLLTFLLTVPHDSANLFHVPQTPPHPTFATGSEKQ